MYATALLSAVNIILLLGCLYLTYTIVTASIIMKYMNTKVNAMLIVPAVGNLLIGMDLTGMLAMSREGENAETDFTYPPLTYTISPSDLLPPQPHADAP